MLAHLSITSVMTVLVYLTVNLLEKFSLVPFNSFVCGSIATILRKTDSLSSYTSQ